MLPLHHQGGFYVDNVLLQSHRQLISTFVPLTGLEPVIFSLKVRSLIQFGHKGVFKSLRLHRLLYLNCRMCTNRTSPHTSKVCMLPLQHTLVFCRDNRTRTCTVISNTCSQNRTDTNYRLHPQFIVPPSGLEPRPEGLVLQTSCYIRIAFCRHNLILCSLPKVTMNQ